VEHAPDKKMLEEQLNNLQPVPSQRFYRRMGRAAWTPLARARRRAFAATGLVLILVVAMLALTPQGRAWAQEVIHFFTRATSDTMPVPTAAPLIWVNITPGVPAPTATPRALFTDCGDFNSPKCSVEQIRSKVDFPVRELGTVPQGMHFAGATGGSDRIVLFYDNGEFTYGLTIVEEPWTGSSEMTKWEIGASAVVETVQIGSVTGEYVKGGFNTQLVEAPKIGDVKFDQVWDARVGLETLHWISDGIFFSMSTWDNDFNNILLDRDAFVALAAGLTTEPVSTKQTYVPATETPVPVITYDGDTYNLSVSQAENQAGFNVLEPGRLPDVLTFGGASYAPEQKIVRIFYIEQPSGLSVTFGLRVSEELAPNTADCILCSTIRGDYGDFLTEKNSMVIGAETVIETVQVGGFTGQYIEGKWGPSNSGWAWLPYPEIKNLRWQAHGLAFELQYSGFWLNNEIPISKADLITIAENMMK
jgi:hypothetical protein